MHRDRVMLAQLLKSWAQDHDHNYQINDPAEGDQGVENTAVYLSWLLKENNGTMDLVTLLDRLEMFMERMRKGKLYPDGMYCRKCRTFYHFAEPNQSDGTLLCYSCRNNPYG